LARLCREERARVGLSMSMSIMAGMVEFLLIGFTFCRAAGHRMMQGGYREVDDHKPKGV
jgi:hypothetical protein